MSEQKYRIRLIDSGRITLQTNEGTLKTQNQQYSQQQLKPKQGVGIHTALLKRFQSFLLNQKLIKLSIALKKHCGRHYPIAYRPQFGFHEYWQDKKYKIQECNFLQYFQYPHWYYYLFAVMVLISKIGLIFTISIHRLFQFDSSNQWTVFFWGLLTLFCDGILQYQLFSRYQYFKEGDILKYIRSFWKDILLLIYFLTISLHYSNYDKILLLIDLFVTCLLSRRCQQIKKCFRLQILSTKYKDAFNVVQLFSTLLPIAHVFAIMLYFVTQFNKERNWLTTHNLDHLNSIEKYIYSLYFAFTTMLTVGYGDISPVNIPQIIVIMCIQIIGIVTYGYIVNEIGHIIGHMRLEDEILSRDISTVSKMAKYYDLDRNLVQKAKNYLVSQKRQKAQLSAQQQESTLKKLHDDLRQQISRQNSLRILKSSLFYVCNWTKQFQIQIAKKIHKKIFSPNEEIIQIPGKQRIYVFKKGKVQIHADRSSGYKKHFRKILRTIQPDESLQVSDNIYGYSFLMSNTPIKLTAINKQFVVAYYVEKNDFLQTVMDSHLDSEYFFEMKTKIDSWSYPQSWQAPLIINTKQHYFPNIQYLIRKNKNIWYKQQNMRSSITEMRRYRNRTKRVFYESLEQMQGQFVPYVIRMMNELRVSYEANDLKTNNVIQTAKTIQQNLHTRSMTWMSSSVMNDLATFKKQNLHYELEQSKQYTIYFKRFNRSQIIKKMQNSNFMLRAKKLRGSVYKTLDISLKKHEFAQRKSVTSKI